MTRLFALFACLLACAVLSAAAPSTTEPAFELSAGSIVPADLMSLLPQQFQDDICGLEIDSAGDARMNAEDSQPGFNNRNVFDKPRTDYEIFVLIVGRKSGDPDLQWVKSQLQAPVYVHPLFLEPNTVGSPESSLLSRLGFYPRRLVISGGRVLVDQPEQFPSFEQLGQWTCGVRVVSVKLDPGTQLMGSKLDNELNVHATLEFTARPFTPYYPEFSFAPGAATVELNGYYNVETKTPLGVGNTNQENGRELWQPQSASETREYSFKLPKGATMPGLWLQCSFNGVKTNEVVSMIPYIQKKVMR